LSYLPNWIFLLKMALESGADTSLVDSRGRTAWELACALYDPKGTTPEPETIEE
jgi:hypothetical protein